MPGSRHTLDRGKHLGPDRIAKRIAGVGIPVSDVKAATAFYVETLSFRPAAKELEKHRAALVLPGTLGERVELIGGESAAAGSPSFRLIFSVPDLHRTAARLRGLGFPVKQSQGEVVIQDPDGDRIVFIRETPTN